MSSTLFVSKIIGSIAVGSAAIGGTTFALYKLNKEEPFNDSRTSMYLIAKTITNDSNKTTTTIKMSENEKNYQCQFGDQKIVDKTCTVKHLDLSTKLNNNYIQLKTLNDISGDNPTLTNLQQEGNFFKIEVSSSFYESFVKNNNTKLDVVLNTGETSANKFASLTNMFAVNGADVKSKVTYAVGKVFGFKAGQTNTHASGNKITIEASNSTKCIFTKDDLKIDCTIHKFSNNESHSNLSSLNFQADTNSQALGEVVKDNYYLFKFTSEKDAGQFKTHGETSVKLSQSVDGVSSTKIDSVLISDLLPAVVVEHSSNKYAFLLGNYSE